MNPWPHGPKTTQKSPRKWEIKSLEKQASAFCGRSECEGCPNLPALEDFKRWVKSKDAVCEGEVWCPTVWTARR